VIECIPTAGTRRLLYEMTVNCDAQLAEYTGENGFVCGLRRLRHLANIPFLSVL
jgi:hypothetical protein